MGRQTRGSLGDLTTTTAGSPVDTSQAEKIVVTWYGTFVGQFVVEISHDGTYYATAPGFSLNGTNPTSIANTPGQFTMTLPAKFIRGRMFSYTSGTCYARIGFEDQDMLG